MVEDGKACVTAGVCELMLLTLGNEEQTRTKRIEGEVGEGKATERDVVRKGMETAVPL